MKSETAKITTLPNGNFLFEFELYKSFNILNNARLQYNLYFKNTHQSNQTDSCLL